MPLLVLLIVLIIFLFTFIPIVCIILYTSMKGEIQFEGAGCCVTFVAQWLWWLQSDTLSLSPAVAVFFFSSTFSLCWLNSNVKCL